MPTGVIAKPYDTTPGGDGLFCPPAGFAGSQEDYRAWIRTRWDEGNFFQQWMQVLTRRVCLRGPDPLAPNITGPYADGLTTACRNLDTYLASQNPEYAAA